MLVGLAAVAFGASILTAKVLFPLYSINHDEPMYVVESQLLEQGHLTAPARQAEFFRPWASGVRGDKVVMKYAPPWPAVIAASELTTGVRRLAPALTAALLVIALYLLGRELSGSRRVGMLTAALVTFSPVALVLSGTFLPYTFQLLIEVLFAYLLLSGVRLESWPRLLTAGAALGVAFFARPFDALLVAAPFALVVAAGIRRSPAPALRRFALVGAGALPVLALTILYNAQVMGGPLRFPFSVTGSTDKLGFGDRGVFANHTFGYGFDEALRSLANLKAVPTWTFGGFVAVALAVIGLIVSSQWGPRRWAVAGIAVTVPAGYFFFWSPYAIARQWPGLASLGPFYHLPLLVPVALFAAFALDGAITRFGKSLPLAALGATLVIVTAVAVPPKVSRNLRTTQALRAAHLVVSQARLRPAVIFLPEGPKDNDVRNTITYVRLGFESRTPFLQNRPDLSGPVLYPFDLSSKNLDLLDRLPTRVPYRLDAELRHGGNLFSPHLVLRRLHVRRGPSIAERLRIRTPVAGSCVMAYAEAGGRPTVRVLGTNVAAARSYDIQWTLSVPGRAPTPTSPWSVTVRPDTERGEARVGLAVGPTCELSTAERYERRSPFRVHPGAEPRLDVLGPGQGWHLVRIPRRAPFWVREDVDGVVSERR